MTTNQSKKGQAGMIYQDGESGVAVGYDVATNQSNWESRFHDKFVSLANDEYFDDKDIVDFIRTLLAEQREETIEKIEKLGIKCADCDNPNCGNPKVAGYQEAKIDILQIIKSKI